MQFYRHGLSSADAKAVADVLDTPFLTSGAVGKKVEAQIAEFFGQPHALLVNSWTNGALAVLLALDLKPGDEVIIPAPYWPASGSVMRAAFETSAKNLCGICRRMPAPSPVLGSLPAAPR